MSKTRVPIKVFRAGIFLGYIQSVSYSRNKFNITTDIKKAKGYTSQEHIYGEIDRLTMMSGALGYVFTY